MENHKKRGGEKVVTYSKQLLYLIIKYSEMDTDSFSKSIGLNPRTISRVLSRGFIGVDKAYIPVISRGLDISLDLLIDLTKSKTTDEAEIIKNNIKCEREMRLG